MRADTRTKYTVCIKRSSYPPEDCGGVWCYADLLETLAGPDSDERVEMVDWLGRELDSEAFGIDTIIRCLGHLKQERPSRLSV